jgi:hypothetical protein
MKIQGNEKDNNLILSEILANKVRKAREERFPSASDVLDNLGNTKVVFK